MTALTILAAIVVTTHLTRREVPYLLQPVAETPRFSFLRVWRDVSSTFVNRDFVVLFIGALLYAGISGATDALGLYVNTYFWGLAPEQLQYFPLAIIGAIAAFVTLGPIGRVFDKRTVLLTTFGSLMVDGIVVIVLRLAGLMPANGTSALLVILVSQRDRPHLARHPAGHHVRLDAGRHHRRAGADRRVGARRVCSPPPWPSPARPPPASGPSSPASCCSSVVRWPADVRSRRSARGHPPRDWWPACCCHCCS